MLEVKVSVTFLLPGSTLVTSKPIDKKGKTKEELDSLNQQFQKTHHQETISWYSNHQRHTIVIWVRNGVPAVQKMQMSKEAYQWMISEESALLDEYKMRDWKSFSKMKRLKLHLKRTAESLQGKLLDFEVFED
jgi:hypothetical protein